MINEVYNCDCLEYMKTCKDNQFDLAIVDPPYGIGMDNSKKRTKPDRPNSYTKYKDFRYHFSNWDKSRPKKEYFDQLFRISLNQIIFGANYFNNMIPVGKGWVFWNKLNGLNNCFSDGEFIFSSKGVQSRYFECNQHNELLGGKLRIHPTQKPVALYKWLLENYAKEDQVIFDSHVGSGSSRIACYELGFDFIGCELDKDYWEAQEERFLNEKERIDLERQDYKVFRNKKDRKLTNKQKYMF